VSNRQDVADQIADLAARITKLRADNKRLQAENAQLSAELEQANAKRDLAQAENELLKSYIRQPFKHAHSPLINALISSVLVAPEIGSPDACTSRGGTGIVNGLLCLFCGGTGKSQGMEG